MRNKYNVVPNVSAPTTAYPMGRINNNDGSGNGTPVIEELYGDVIEFFTALVINAGIITPNNLPDNATNGYQTLDALRQFASKHNYIGDMILSGANRFYLNQHISNMGVNEFLIVTFRNPTVEEINVVGITQIEDLSGSVYNCSVINDPLYVGSNYIVKKEITGDFRVYSIPTTTSLQSIYDRIGGAEEVLSEALRVVAKGRYSVNPTPSADGLIIIDHPVVSVPETRIIYTITRGNPQSSPVVTDFKELLTDRTNNSFRIVYSGFPHQSGSDYPVVDWWIVRA